MSNLKRRLAALMTTLLVTGFAVFALQSPAAAGTPIYGGVIYGPYSLQVMGADGRVKCLDVTGNSTANGAPMQIYDCLGTQQYNQQFYFWDIDGLPYYYITPSSTWKCLDVRGVSHNAGAVIQQYDCLGNQQYNQIWDVWFDTTYYKWHVVATHSWLSMNTGYPLNGAAVYQDYPLAMWTLCYGNGSCL